MKRVIVWANGISGSGRSDYLKLQQELAEANGKHFRILKVYDYLKKIFDESNLEIKWENILDMNETQLKIATYSAYKDIHKEIEKNSETNFVIDSHGKFLWNNLMIDGFHAHFLREIRPDFCVSIIDNEYLIREKLQNNEQWKTQNLTEKDIVTWIADEVSVARLWADFHNVPWYVIPRRRSPTTLYMLMFEPQRKKVYFAFPMTHALDDGQTYNLQTKLALKLIKLCALTDPRSIEAYGFSYDTKHIANSIFYRDLSWWVNQSQIIFVFYATPVPSIGAASEALQAKFQTKDVYILWPTESKSPFTVAIAKQIFQNEEEFFNYFHTTYGSPAPNFIIPDYILQDAYGDDITLQNQENLNEVNPIIEKVDMTDKIALSDDK